jgi:hypothetical protein
MTERCEGLRWPRATSWSARDRDLSHVQAWNAATSCACWIKPFCSASRPKSRWRSVPVAMGSLRAAACTRAQSAPTRVLGRGKRRNKPIVAYEVGTCIPDELAPVRPSSFVSQAGGYVTDRRAAQACPAPSSVALRESRMLTSLLDTTPEPRYKLQPRAGPCSESSFLPLPDGGGRSKRCRSMGS